MALPLSYNWRNLTARKTTTIMTALGIALTVAVLLSTAALVEGLESSLKATGHPLHLIVMRKGATAELNSLRTPEHLQIVKAKRGIAKNAQGEPMVSLELVTVAVLESPEYPSGVNITFRGIQPAGWEMRESLKIVQGRRFQPGRRELVVGKGVADRYPMARLGQSIDFGRGAWQVVGIMDAGRSAANSEVFCDLNQLASDQNRASVLSSILVRATDEVTLSALRNELMEDRVLNAEAPIERDYYAQQTSSAAPIQFIGVFVAIIMAIGSSFAAMNTMFAAVARRAAEIGTLRVLGFSKGAILGSFFLESVLISVLGGLLGCLLVLPLNNLQTGIGSFVTFSEISFSFAITPGLMALGVGFAVVLGALGGLFPAGSAARKEILTALRER
ncbi:MAG: ABC transporter permease [Bryobacter sp.]|nr:ABC transporter permease [Bryobacter sp.]